MSNDNLLLVDNIENGNTVSKYLKEWCSVSRQFDIATGYFEIGALLELDGEWQKLEKIRIILGSEVTQRTNNLLQEAVNYLLKKFDDSIDHEKEINDFLVGVPAILNAMKTGKIECRVFDKDKFHAKAYITYFRDEYYSNFITAMNVPVGYGLVGSSNFTKAGLTRNFELNVQFSTNIDKLQEWYGKRWEDAVDVTEAVLKTLEVHCREYTPYDVYLKSMFELYMTREESISEWEEHQSIIYGLLAQYQKDGYNSLVRISEKYKGAFLCDGVGLGKTYQGLMLIERFVKKERKNVVLIVPASTRISVWETSIRRHIPEILEGFYSFKIINHTDLLLEKNNNLLEKIAEQAECIIIDEAHHFRNRGSGRYKKLYDIVGQGEAKQLFMLTATPINNSFLDIQHMIELFTQRVDNYFSLPPLGIHSLIGHFKKMETKLETILNEKAISTNDASIESDMVFRHDTLVSELVVQRSRSYVKKSLNVTESKDVLFPYRQPPTVVDYSLEKSYGRLISDFVDSFYRTNSSGTITPLLTLAVYSPYGEPYFIGDRIKIDAMKLGRQNQVVNLIRQLLLKRFESSSAAFEETCIRIFVRLKRFIEDYSKYGNVREITLFFERQHRVINYVTDYYNTTTDNSLSDLEDELPDYLWDIEENLSINDFNIQVMLEDTINDLEVLSEFIKDLMAIKPKTDDKINALINILGQDIRLYNNKVLIFSEYKTTAQYIYKELKEAGFSNLYELDGMTKCDRREVIERFSPYYNGKSNDEIENRIDILIATDVLAEGLNLQDATCLINYDLHWNPVRLMQRIGRIDRRRSRLIEEVIINNNSSIKDYRENVYYWNFLPPKELENLLKLYKTVSHKTLRISKTFGIEGRKLLTPDDDYESLKEFNSAYEGEETYDESMSLEFQQLMEDNPNYSMRYAKLPKKIFSGKIKGDIPGVFMCYRLPDKGIGKSWSEEEELYKWYFYNIENDTIGEDSFEIWNMIRTDRNTARVVTIEKNDFGQYRKKIEKYINRTYMRKIQAPIGFKPVLVGWMEINII